MNLITISENNSEIEKFQEIDIKHNNMDKIGKQPINSFKLGFLFKKDLNGEKDKKKLKIKMKTRKL